MAKQSKNRTVFVALSGGVDSAVAAGLLQRRGYDVVGVHLRCFNVDGCAARDLLDARRVAETLGIPFYVLDFEEAYKQRVVDYMVRGYRKGITPNPDIMCNREIKFGLFFEKAISMGADFVATGHYVKIRVRESKNQKTGAKIYVLAIARDKNKDQSYFLWTLTQDHLRRCLFPIGAYIKPDVRKIAKRFGLPNAEKKDSQGICFLGKIPLSEFLSYYIPERPGDVVSMDGEVLGTHRGAHRYTIGQRHIGIENRCVKRDGHHETAPLYVVTKDVIKNIVTVASGSDNTALYRSIVKLTDVHIVSPIMASRSTVSVMARIRYRQPLAKAKLLLIRSNSQRVEPQRAKLVFEDPQKSVASGQSAVFYTARGELIGGGVIL